MPQSPDTADPESDQFPAEEFPDGVDLTLIRWTLSLTPPPAPESWGAILGALEKAHKDCGDLVRSTPEDKLGETVKFFIGPGTLGDWSRLKFAWFLLHDQIHHRGQFSIYLRMAGGKVPSIYGPTADEPWM